MIRDIDAFLSPYGGDERPAQINSWFDLILGAALWPRRGRTPLMDFLYPDTKNDVYAVGHKLWADRSKKLGAPVKIESPPGFTHQPSPDEVKRRHAAKMVEKYEELAGGKKLTKEKFLYRRKSATQLPGGLSRSLYLIGAGYLFGGAFSVALDAFAPGVSQIAQRKDDSLFTNENYVDSGQAYTQRQRAVQAIYDSQMATRNVLGNEAQYLHM